MTQQAAANLNLKGLPFYAPRIGLLSLNILYFKCNCPFCKLYGLDSLEDWIHRHVQQTITGVGCIKDV